MSVTTDDRLLEMNRIRVQRWRDVDPDRQYNANIKRKYGVTLDWYNEQLDMQNGVCAICERPPIERNRLHIDHCHSTNKVRGLLCNACNMYVGMFESQLRPKIAAYVEAGGVT